MNWKIEVIFIGDSDDYFVTTKISMPEFERLFSVAIKDVIDKSGIVPVIGDQVQVVIEPDYAYTCKVYDRIFYPTIKRIQYHIK